MLRRRAHRNRRTLAQALRQLHSRAPCACFVGALIGTAAHFRKPSGSFIHARRARASSARSSEPPHTSASPPAASFTRAVRVLCRYAHRKRRTPPREPSGSFIHVRHARASSARLSKAPTIPASAAQALRRLYQGAQPFAVGSLCRRAYRLGGLAYQPIFQLRVARVEAPARRDGQRAHRKRCPPPRLPRKPSGGFTKVRSRSP